MKPTISRHAVRQFRKRLWRLKPERAHQILTELVAQVQTTDGEEVIDLWGREVCLLMVEGRVVTVWREDILHPNQAHGTPHGHKHRRYRDQALVEY